MQESEIVAKRRDLRCFSDQPGSKIVQCGEPIPQQLSAIVQSLMLRVALFGHRIHWWISSSGESRRMLAGVQMPDILRLHECGDRLRSTVIRKNSRGDRHQSHPIFECHRTSDRRVEATLNCCGAHTHLELHTRRWLARRRS